MTVLGRGGKPKVFRIAGSAVLGLAIVVGSVPVGFAGTPLKTNDPDTPGRNRWEINLSYTYEMTHEPIEIDLRGRRKFAVDTFNGVLDNLDVPDPFRLPDTRIVRRRVGEHALPLVDVNYGFTERDQLKIEFPVAIEETAEGQTLTGAGNLQLGYKLRLLDEKEQPFSLSIYPQLELPTGPDDVGGSREMVVTAPVQIGKRFFDDRLFCYGEVGFTAAPAPDTDDEWFYGAAAEWTALKDLTLLGEVYGSVPTHGSGSSDVAFNVGLKWQLTDKVAFITSMGRSFRSDGGDHPEFTGLWGLQVKF